MGILGSVLATLGITKSSTAPAAASEREQRALAAVRDVEAQHAAARERTEARAAELAEAGRVLESAEGELRTAGEAYDGAPTEAAGRKVLRAREAHELAALRVDGARRRHGEALAEGQKAAELVAQARAALDTARADVELVGILEAASLEVFRARIAPHLAAALDAEERLRSAVAEIDRAYFETNDAARKARELGADVPDLDHAHAFAPVLLTVREGDPSMLRPTLIQFNEARLFAWPDLAKRTVLGPVRLEALRAVVSHGPRTPPGEEAADRTALEALLSGRTYAEGLEALAKSREQHKPAPATVAHEGPTPIEAWSDPTHRPSRGSRIEAERVAF